MNYQPTLPHPPIEDFPPNGYREIPADPPSGSGEGEVTACEQRRLARRVAHAFNYWFVDEAAYAANFLPLLEALIDEYEHTHDVTVSPDVWRRPDGTTYSIEDDDEDEEYPVPRWVEER